MLVLLGGGRFDSWLWNTRGGMFVYLVVLGLAILLWLGPKIQNWFGWPEDPAEQDPVTLGLDSSKPDGKGRRGGQEHKA